MSGSMVKHILVVDDEESYRDLIKRFLDRKGYECRSASDGSEALQMLEAHHFDLVISDVQMEEMDGIQLMQQARKTWSQLKFILITGHGAAYPFTEMIAAGASDYITKPFELGELDAKLSRIEKELGILCRLQGTNRALELESEINASIAKLSEALMKRMPVEEISTLVLDCARRLTHSPIGCVCYIDRKTESWVQSAAACETWNKIHPAYNDILTKQMELIGASMLKSPGTNITRLEPDELNAYDLPEVRTPEYQFLSVPARVQDKLLGMVMLADADRSYTEKDLMVASRLAAIFAQRVELKWIYGDLRRANDSMESILANSVEGIGIVDRNWRAIRWNRAAERIYGYSLSDLEGMPIWKLYADKQQLALMLSRLRKEGYISRYEIDMRKKNGEVAPFEVSISMFRDSDNEITGSVCVAMDLSDLKKSLAASKALNEELQKEVAERKRIEAELREARDKLAEMVEERTARLSKAGELLKRSMDRIKDATQG
jgi:PAS domain S-box-containing protein